MSDRFGLSNWIDRLSCGQVAGVSQTDVAAPFRVQSPNRSARSDDGHAAQMGRARMCLMSLKGRDKSKHPQGAELMPSGSRKRPSVGREACHSKALETDRLAGGGHRDSGWIHDWAACVVQCGLCIAAWRGGDCAQFFLQY